MFVFFKNQHERDDFYTIYFAGLPEKKEKIKMTSLALFRQKQFWTGNLHMHRVHFSHRFALRQSILFRRHVSDLRRERRINLWQLQ